jgi:hypothetical protein
VNFQNEQHLSVAFADRSIVMVVPVPTVPEATNRQTLTVTPTAAAAVGAFVYSPSFVQVPVPPETVVWSFVSPSAVEMLSETMVRMPWSPDASVFVAVVIVHELLLVEEAPVPSVPTEAIAIA